MSNWWELQPKLNSYNKPDYQETEVKIISFEAENFKNEYCSMQPVTIEGPDGCSITQSWMIPTNSQEKLNPEIQNIVTSCRVKVENNNSQYAYNGRKYTFAFRLAPKEAGSGGGKRGGGGGYRKDTPEEILGKCVTLLFCAEVGRVGLITLDSDEAAKSAGIRLAKALLDISGT